MNKPVRSSLNNAPVAAPEGTPPAPAGPDLLLLEGTLFWDKYKLPIVSGILLLVLALVGSELYQMDRDKKMRAASAELDSAKTPAAFRHIMDTYPGTMPAANAALLLGRNEFDAKDYAGAAGTWRTFADRNPQHTLAPEALIGAGTAFEALGKNDEARSVYQRAATSYQSSFAAPMAQLAEAALLKAEHKPEDARRVYENLMASSPNTDAARQAASELRFLRVMPADPGSTPLPGAMPSPSAAAATAAPVAVGPKPGVPLPPPAATALPGAPTAPTTPAASATVPASVAPGVVPVPANTPAAAAAPAPSASASPAPH